MTNYIIRYFTLALLLVPFALLISCDDSQEDKDMELILDYIANKNLDAQKTAEGIYYVIDNPGTGTRPDINSTVTVDYEGFLVDDRKFDSSIDRGMASTFALTRVIRGWQLGIPLFKKGGKGKLIIPSHLGYGGNPPPGIIPINAVLVFNVELIDVK